jgi:predicted porin
MVIGINGVTNMGDDLFAIEKWEMAIVKTGRVEQKLQAK